ncbi:hypothetical protein NDU88_004778 [Pleurodeles waltl]|uniref:Uncharacterized protein n=1 Tax=Pleurodeles waltl TaxID=8319 RepID=A0AAV7RLG1_PLEWA|nr:hypothetical protein NDU88_004778 [Pleurodeles waltl]
MERDMKQLETELPLQEDRLEELCTIRKNHAELEAQLGNQDYKYYLVRHHEEVEKMGRLLAWLLQECLARSPIGAIKSSDGITLNTQLSINATYVEYCCTLSTADFGSHYSTIKDYLLDIPSPSLNPLKHTELD